MGKGRATVDDIQDLNLRLDRIWRPVFDHYDENHDGFIPLEDLKRFLHEGNLQLNEDFPPEVLEEILEKADWDKSGTLSFPEFLHMVHARELGAQHPYLRRLIRYAARSVVPKNQRQSTVRNYIEHYNCLPPPLFLLSISILEIAAFVYYSVQMGNITDVPFKSDLIYNPHKRYEVWRYMTYMFIHAGVLHLVFNVVVQLALGIPLEMVHKWWRVGFVYVGGVIAGSLGASISDPYTYLAGASGGVYALIAGHLANVIINWKEMEFNWIRLTGLIIFGAIDFGTAIYERYFTNSTNKTSYAAHLAGATAGLLLGVIFLHNLQVRKWEIVLGWFSLVLFILLMGTAIIWNVAYPNYFPLPYDQWQ
ncbi:Rhomboid-related protein 3 [Halotydeus destructor]|nr:Rhomboid-related protein 3 [Halotydeus destructor]